MNRITRTIFGLACLAVGAAAMAFSAPEGLTRTELQRHDLSIEEREAIQTRVDFAPGGVSPWHSHPGEELIYVPEGKLEFQVKGKSPFSLRPEMFSSSPPEPCIWRVTPVRPAG